MMERGGRSRRGIRRVGKAQRAHHLKRGKNGGHVAALLCPPDAALVVPANAGTHNPGHRLLKSSWPLCSTTAAAAYGSRVKPGTTASLWLRHRRDLHDDPARRDLLSFSHVDG